MRRIADRLRSVSHAGTRIVVAALLATVLAALTVSRSVAEPAGDTPALSKTTEWVLTKVRSGEVADVSQLPEADRVLPADDLRMLLTRRAEKDQPAPDNLRIEHAMIVGPLDLRDAEIPFIVSLQYCIFDGDVTLSGNVFRKDLILSDSVFRALRLGGASVEASLVLDKATISSLGDFAQIRVGQNLSAQGAKFTSDTEVVNFSRAHVGGNGWWNKATIAGPTTFLLADVSEDLEFDGAVFEWSSEPADFNRITVGKATSFVGARLKRDASFRLMNLKGYFDAKDATFVGANFSESTIERSVSDFQASRRLGRSSFAGPP